MNAEKEVPTYVVGIGPGVLCVSRRQMLRACTGKTERKKKIGQDLAD